MFGGHSLHLLWTLGICNAKWTSKNVVSQTSCIGNYVHQCQQTRIAYIECIYRAKIRNTERICWTILKINVMSMCLRDWILSNYQIPTWECRFSWNLFVLRLRIYSSTHETQLFGEEDFAYFFFTHLFFAWLFWLWDRIIVYLLS